MDIILPGTGHCSSDRERRGYAVLTGKEDSSDRERDAVILGTEYCSSEREKRFLTRDEVFIS
jgi:hypothetical protein